MTVEKKLSATKQRTRAEVQQVIEELASSGMQRVQERSGFPHYRAVPQDAEHLPLAVDWAEGG